MNFRFRVFAFVLMLVGTAFVGTASAGPIVPTYDQFGEWASANFGGSGIPNDSVAMSSHTDYITIPFGGQIELGSFTMGVTFHQRFDNPPVTNNGAGVFYASAGSDASSMPNPNYAQYNFGFEIQTTGLGGLAPLTHFRLLYDMDPGVGTDQADMGVINLLLPPENSWNYGMTFLCNSIPPFSSAPMTGCPFDPSTPGEYGIALQAIRDGQVFKEASALIVVENVPEPASLVLLGMGFLGAGAVSRRRKRQQVQR